MRNNNFSSSEDFTESQNFDRFLNAEDSDAEDKALQSTVNKKMQAKGFYDSKKPATQTYPSYQGASYGGASASQGYGTSYGGYGGTSYGSGYGGGYGNTSTANKQGSGYGTGYGDYGGGYGGGYGASGYGAGTGYGGSYGSGYGGTSGYGGGGNAYSGYDITGFGGSGYGGAGAGAGTGYKDNDEDEDEYGDDYEEDDDENKEEGGGFGLDLKSVMERKAAQKAAKEAEEKKAEEEKARKAKAAAAAQASSLKTSGLKTAGSKKDKGKGKVSFDLGAEIPDDSDNENNQNISHISEKSHSSGSSEERNKANRFKTAKEKEKEDLSSKMILNMSDDNKSSEASDRKKGNLESVEDIDSKADTKNKATPKKEETISDSYADDFEESSKFGSSDYGKTNLKIATKLPEKKADDFEESSNYLTESKDAQVEEKPSTKVDERPSNKDTYSKPQNLVYQPVTSTLTQNYETRAAKDYVYESLLNDERRRVDKLETQLNLGGDQLKTVQQLVQEKDLTIHKLEAQTQSLQKELDIQKSEGQDLSKQNKIYEVELENQQKRIEVLENKVLELEAQKRILAKDNEDKTKTIKERKDYLEKNFESKALNELRTQIENEKDLLMMKIEELQDENKKFKEEADKTREDSRLYKTSFRQKAESDQEVKRLKQEIMLLEMKLKDRDQVKQKKLPEHAEHEKENINLISGIPELDKETQMQELLIRGFQKENEKLMSENKLLKREIEELHGKLYDENKKVTEMKVRLVNNTDSVLITDKEIDIETKKMLGAENLISKNDLKVAQAKISQLHHEMQTREDAFKQREIELKYEMDRLRSQKMELEGKIGGVDMGSLKKQDEDYKQLQRTVEEERRVHENEIRDLKSKLNWYIQNQESLTAKEEVIRQKNEVIKNLEEEIARILSDPNTNLDAKSKYYNKVSNEDKKRIKQLERDVESLEEALKKRNPGVYDKMKSQQDESTTVKELRQSLKKVQEEKATLEAEYETKLNDFRQRFDKMKLGYENKTGEPTGAKGEKNSNPADNQEKEVLKARIKELEKEVEDAKKYYLKKAQALKDNKKGGKSVERPVKSAVPTSKKVQFDAKDELEFQFTEDKENVKSAGNAIIDEEKANLIDNLVNLHLTPVHSILNTFESYKNNIINGFERNNNQLISSSSQELTRVINSTLSGFSQKEDILQKLKKIEQLALIDKKDPLPTVEATQRILYDIVWNELRKEKSVITTSTSKPSAAKVNNFFSQDQDSEVSERRLIVMEDTLKKKEEDLLTTQQKLNQVTSENVRLLKDKSNLELIIQQLPKNPRSLDFATMEKKLEIMERNYKEQELELKNAFRKAYNMDPFQTTSEADINKVKAYEKEIAQLKSALDRKNQEIYVFRQEMEVILKELNKFRRNKA